MSDRAYELYSAALCKFPECDVRAVVNVLARKRRGEGEKAFPALGDLVEPLESMAAHRRRQAAERVRHDAAMADFWRWVDERIADTGIPE